MPARKDRYSRTERQEYNRHYYPHNRDKILESRKNPISVRRRKIQRIRKKYESMIANLLNQMAVEMAKIDEVSKQHEQRESLEQA